MTNSVLTDIHAHILPGLDDGPADIAETKALLDAMRQAHIQRAFCTSHYHSPHFNVCLDDIQHSFQTVCCTDEIPDNHPELRIGAEIRLAQRFADDIKLNQIPTLGDTHYVLVEFDTIDVSEQALALIYELVIRQYTPIMAHPERNLAIRKNPQLIDTLRSAGLLMQATANCFTVDNYASHRPFALAWTLLKQGKIDVIASDTHNISTRPPGLIEAYDNIAAKLGSELADMLIDNANAIWNDEACTPVEAVEAKVQQRSKLRGWLVRR